MEVSDLTNIAKKEKINIFNFKMRKTKARIIEYDNTCIFINYSKIHTYTEKR